MNFTSLRLKQELLSNAPMRWVDILSEEIDSFLSSDTINWMRIGQRYYDGDHDVLSIPRTAIGDFGRLVNVDNIADNRLVHNFARELCDQKTQYLLGKPYSVQCDIQEYSNAIQVALGKNFHNLLRRLAKDAINYGIAWLHAFYDEKGNFRLARCPSDEMIPIWLDADHERLDAMIRIYDSVEYVAKQKNIVRHAQLWHNDTLQNFRLSQGKWIPDSPPLPAMTRFCPHSKPQAHSWQALPFIPLKYNDEERPLVRPLKSLIDNYDRVVSDNANALQDQPNNILVLRNYDGQRLDEFRRNLASYRAVKVSDDGGVEALNTPLAFEAVSKHLERLRRDIYAFGRGVDTRSEYFANAASGVALRHQYAQLDLDCNGLEYQIHQCINALLPFLRQHFAFQNLPLPDSDPDIHFVFNRDILINEDAAIQMCRDSLGLISPLTIAENHPWVRDAASELAALYQNHSTDSIKKEDTHE